MKILVEQNMKFPEWYESEFAYEFNDIVTLDNVITCIQRAEMVQKIVEEVVIPFISLPV